jgi:hypothetical protein
MKCKEVLWQKTADRYKIKSAETQRNEGSGEERKLASQVGR